MRGKANQPTTSTKPWFSLALVFSFLVAVAGLIAPERRRPIDVQLMLWWSLPLAGVWLATSIISIFRYHIKALWLLLGGPLALYWPLWLLFKHIPACYWQRNCK